MGRLPRARRRAPPPRPGTGAAGPRPAPGARPGGTVIARNDLPGGTRPPRGKPQHLAKRTFRLVRRQRCRFAFVEDPWLDYAAIYDTAYYEGRGADPTVDYHFELAHPDRAIRRYEWSGIVEVVRRLVDLRAQTRWLDFG